MIVILGFMLILAGAFLVIQNQWMADYFIVRHNWMNSLTMTEVRQNIVISGAVLVLGGFLFCVL